MFHGNLSSTVYIFNEESTDSNKFKFNFYMSIHLRIVI